ncbi:hypothetical protein FALCPG4_018379 [Fusarium falciforme]
MPTLRSVLLACLVTEGVLRRVPRSMAIEVASLPNCASSCLATAIADSPFTKNVTSTNCGAPIRDKSSQYKTLCTSFLIISSVFVVTRFAFKIWAKLDLGLDDWFILITILVGIPNSVVTVCGTIFHGLGRDIWTLTYTNITNFGKFFLVTAILYFLQVTLLKLALLFFYLRIFPATSVRRILWSTIIFNSLFGIIFLIVTIFQCKPISYFWTNWDGEHEGSCVNLNAIAWANSGISIALDIWMLAIPLSQLKALNLGWRKKIGAGMMFSLGTFVTVMSIMRLRSLIKFGSRSQNITWEYLDISKWSTIELNVGIICTCMPTLRLILVRIFPKVFGTTHQPYTNYAGRPGKSQSKSRLTETSVMSNGDGSEHRINSNRITCDKTYAVEYGDNDEIQLVSMGGYEEDARFAPSKRTLIHSESTYKPQPAHLL